MRYQVVCPGTPGAADWSIASEGDAGSYRVDAKNWASDRSFALLDARSVVVAEGRMRSTWRHEVCDLYRGGEFAGYVSTSLLREIRSRFCGELPGPDRLEMEGDFHGQQYSFFRCSRTVALVSTVWDDSGSSFGVEIRANEDHPLILAAAIAIRCLCGEPVRGRSRIDSDGELALRLAGSVRAAV